VRRAVLLGWGTPCAERERLPIVLSSSAQPAAGGAGSANALLAEAARAPEFVLL
jgi:hypothetical protein